MSEFKGTKGDWYLRENFCTIACNKNNLLARVYDAKGNALHPEIEQDFEIVKANALLISKAPEMLEMLNHILFQVFWNGGSLNLKDKENIEQLIKEATEL
jgi:hypothetical protein